jgi:Ca2+-transporting ATPase
MPETEVRALAFVTLVLINVGLALVNRSFSTSLAIALRRPNAALWWVLATAATILTIALAWNPARALFRFGPLHGDDLVACFATALVVLALLEQLKSLWHARLAA